MIRPSHAYDFDYHQDVGNLNVLDRRLYLALRDWPRRGRMQSPRPTIQRDQDEETSGAYR